MGKNLPALLEIGLVVGEVEPQTPQVGASAAGHTPSNA